MSAPAGHVGGSPAPAVPLLDKGTELAHEAPRGAHFALVIWPTCGEATVIENSGYEGDSLNLGQLSPEERERRNRLRAASRARAVSRRYCLHNGLGRMITGTYAEACENIDQASEDFRNFRRRLLRCEWFDLETFPYCWVLEAGKRTRRLHLHVAVGEWWDRLGCVEVCERCASDGLRRKRRDIPPAGSHCIGCVWAHGFIGRPIDREDPSAVAHYAAKYVGKSLGEGMTGRQAYRVAEGFQPQPLRVFVRSWDEAQEVVSSALGVELQRTEAFALHDEVSEWAGRPTWAVKVTRDETEQ